MRSIIEFINESNDGKWFRFIFKEFKDTQIVQSLSNIASNSGIYTERIDGGIAIKIKDGSKDPEKLIETITDFINAHQKDEGKEDAIEKLTNTLASLQDYVEDIADGE